MSGQPSLKSTRTRVRVAKNDVPIRDSFVDDMGCAAFHGAEFAETSDAHHVLEAWEADQKLRQRVLGYGRGSQAARKAAYASFFFGYNVAARAAGDRRSWQNSRIAAALARVELAKALLWLPNRRHREFFAAHEACEQPERLWRIWYDHAMAMARFLDAAIADGMQAYYGLERDVAFHDIDLHLVGAGVHYAARVIPDQREGGSRVETIRDDRDLRDADRWVTSQKMRIWRGTNRFAEANRMPTRALLVRIGSLDVVPTLLKLPGGQRRILARELHHLGIEVTRLS